jgi:hypothetical protein
MHLLYTHKYAYNVSGAKTVPNKTIYIKDSDVEVWDRAQKKLGGESISSIITDYLRERAAPHFDNVEAMNELLSEVSKESKLALELHPFWSSVILDANTIDVGYKLHQKRANPDRIISLIVDPFNFDRDGRFNAKAKTRIKAEIAKFWDGKRTDKHVVVRISYVDIPPRLQNLVGKRGLVMLKPSGKAGREFEFAIVAVHPASDIPGTGGDDELQRAITQSEFTVKFEDGTFIDGSNYKVISGRYISLIRGRY